MLKRQMVWGLAMAAATGSATAAPLFKVTEAYTGVSGEDGTVDWFEVTNFGDMDGDTGTLLFDDSNPSVSSAGTMTSFILSPGESAVFLIEGLATDITDFTTIWGSIAHLGVTSAGGGLGDDTDSVNIGVDNAGTFDVIDSLEYTATLAGELQTIEDVAGDGPIALSVLGSNGAYESNAFFNDNIGGAEESIALIGSPGLVPEPASLVLLGLGGLALAGRRRA